jgi:hypothetical protein
VRSFVPIIILIVFTLIGGVIFMTIEGPHERYEMEKLKHERERLLEVKSQKSSTINIPLSGHRVSIKHHQTYDTH